jgi:glycosyltransferase involved in cell wall biosynthesis
MKILQVCPKYYPSRGGVEEHVRNISERLAEKYDVSVFTTDPSGKLPKQEAINGVKIKRFKSWAPNEAYYFSRGLKKYLTKNSDGYDIMHAHSYHAFPALYTAQAKSTNKLVYTPHYTGGGQTFLRNLLHIPYKFLVSTIFEKADKIICVSNYEKKLLLKRFKISDEKFIHIPNGVNLEEFRGLEKKKKDYRVILTVARLEKYKGVQFLIRALKNLSDDIILEIIGKGQYRDSLVKLARKLNVSTMVRFYQDLPRKELLQKYANADVFVLLSKYEAMPISLAEALATRTPCIVSNIPFLKEWVDNENCFGIDYPININDLVSLIKKVIGIQIKGVKLLDWNDVVQRLEGIYGSL